MQNRDSAIELQALGGIDRSLTHVFRFGDECADTTPLSQSERGGIQTHGLSIKSRMLYQAELHAQTPLLRLELRASWLTARRSTLRTPEA